MESKQPVIRQFSKDADYPTVAAWWGASAVHPSCLTQHGIFGFHDGREVVCAWFYADNRSNVAKVENIIWNPEHAGDETPLAYVLDFFRLEAEKLGKRLEVETPFQGSPIALKVSKAPDFVDRLEAAMGEFVPGHHEERHIFTPGLYTREIFIPAGTLLTSKIHATQHPFVISKGDVSVWTEATGTVRLKAPHTGITVPGTRRVIFTHEDTIWTTFHVGEEKTVDEFEARIIRNHKNPFLEEGAK